jgi:hypothetical protein
MFQNELKEYVATSGLVNMKSAGDGIYLLCGSLSYALLFGTSRSGFYERTN